MTSRLKSPRIASALCALALGSWSADATAQTPREDAENLLRQGFSQRRDGMHEAALDSFRRSVEALRTGRALAHMGLAEQSLGRWLDAEAHLQEALTLRDQDSWVGRHHRTLEEALDEVRRNIGALELTCSVRGAEIRVNGRVVGTAPLPGPLRLPIGRVAVEARAEGYESLTRSVIIHTGQTTREELSMGRVVTRRAEPPPPPRCAAGMVLRNGLCYPVERHEETSSLSPWRVMFFSGLGVATLSGAIAIGLWVDGDSTADGYLERCGGAVAPPACQSDWASTQEALSGRAVAVNTFWVLTGVGVAVAAVGFGLDRVRAGSGRRASQHAPGLALSPAGLRWSW